MKTNNAAGDHCQQCGKPHAQADIDGGRCLACGTMLCAEPERNRFTIVWRDSAYRVSIPDYNGGEVVTAAFHDATVAALRQAIKEAPCDSTPDRYGIPECDSLKNTVNGRGPCNCWKSDALKISPDAKQPNQS